MKQLLLLALFTVPLVAQERCKQVEKPSENYYPIVYRPQEPTPAPKPQPTTTPKDKFKEIMYRSINQK